MLIDQLKECAVKISLKQSRDGKSHLETLPQWLTEVLGDLVHTNTAHRPDSQSSDERVRVLTVLGEGINSKDGQVWL